MTFREAHLTSHAPRDWTNATSRRKSITSSIPATSPGESICKNSYPNHKFPPEFIPSGVDQWSHLSDASLARQESRRLLTPTSIGTCLAQLELNLEQCQNLANVPTRAFRSRYLWDKDGKKTDGFPAGQAISPLDDARHHPRPRQHGRRSPQLLAALRHGRRHSPQRQHLFHVEQGRPQLRPRQMFSRHRGSDQRWPAATPSCNKAAFQPAPKTSPA